MRLWFFDFWIDLEDQEKLLKEHWRALQNAYFKEKGLDIAVDAIGILGQEHLGPVRMRKFMSEALARAEDLKHANQEMSNDLDSIAKPT